MIEFLFLDMDDTILDFRRAEHIALGKTLRQFGLEPTEAVCSRYSISWKNAVTGLWSNYGFSVIEC